MSKVAYELRAEYEDSGFGGVIGYGPDRHAFDVAEYLELGGGKIVTSDSLLISALDQYPALKRTTVGDAAELQLPGVAAAEQPEEAVPLDVAEKRNALIAELEKKNLPDLEKEADNLKLEVPSGTKKNEIIQTIADARLSGDQD